MKLHYKKLGTGQPLLVLHGLFGSLDNWMTLAKKWSNDFEVYLVDQRNHGQSPHSEEFSYPLMAEDLKELMDQLELKSAILLGHSMGGKTVMEFSMKYPEMIEKLIVVDIAPVSYNVHHHTIIEALRSVPLSDISSRKEAESFLSQHIKDFGTRQFLLKNLYWENKDKLAWRFNLEVLADQILPISEYAIMDGAFEKETLFIAGANSDYILPEYGSNIKSKFPNYKLKSIPGAGHWVHAEKMDEFSEIVMNFLKS
ncbi:MAG: pimeloyl-ACP methyl ester carboxylesterase [Vicingaceae bacterium]|jgi:pimeloyl-ACP methyl ester carboxylesterase